MLYANAAAAGRTVCTIRIDRTRRVGYSTMWRNLNLRARILIGYGVVLALAGALALFMIFQVATINRQIAAINASATADAAAGARLAARVADVQAAVDAYLRHPGAEARGAVERTFDVAEAEAGRLQGERYAAFRRRLTLYHLDLLVLNALLDAQERLSADANMRIFEAGVLASGEIAGEFVIRRGGLAGVAELTEAQQRLHRASLLLGQALADQDRARADRALQQIEQAQAMLERNARRPAPSSGLEEALAKTPSAAMATRQLVDNISRVRVTRDEQLAPQAAELKQQADAIAAGALGRLANATADLERRVVRAQQIAGLALLATIVLAALFGLRLARGLARPLVDLAGAVERVNGGDFGASVAGADGGEIGRLARAFNQMTATLRRQRDEVRAQHEAMAERNRELEQALGELQAAAAARDELASTVRALSVPVVPIIGRVIALPLVGEIDAGRAAVLLERLLAGVASEQARVVILDITGVPFVDAETAQWLLQAAAAAELLGARCVLTGISPEVAQALVASGADLGRLVTRADLRGGVEYAMRTMRESLV